MTDISSTDFLRGNKMLYSNFEKIRDKARQDEALRKALIDAADGENPLSAFCAIAREHGCEIYPMDVIARGEEYYAAMKRSTNGGGENSHMQTGWGNYFQLLVHELSMG